MIGAANVTEVRRRRMPQFIDGLRLAEMPEYRAYRAMLSRCYNSNVPTFNRYGGRGILVCDRWLEGFENFYADMGRRPSDKHSLDRIDNDKGYEPRNCRWTTIDVQANNRTLDGETYWSPKDIDTLISMWADYRTVEEISEALGRSVRTIRKRASLLNLQRDWSASRLVRIHADLAHVLRERGVAEFKKAVANKKRLNRRKGGASYVPCRPVSNRPTCAFDDATFAKIKRLSEESGVSISKQIRILVEKGLSDLSDRSRHWNSLRETGRERA